MMSMVVVSGEEGGNAAMKRLMNSGNSGNYFMKNCIWVPYPPAGSIWVSFVRLTQLVFRQPFPVAEFYDPKDFTSLSRGYVEKTGLCPRVDVELLWSN